MRRVFKKEPVFEMRENLIFPSLVVARAATRPRDKLFSQKEYGHDVAFSDNGNSGHRIFVEALNSVNQVKGGCERRDDSTVPSAAA